MNSSEIRNAEDKIRKTGFFFFLTCSKRRRKGHLPKRQLKWNSFSNYKIKECLLEESVAIKYAKKETIKMYGRFNQNKDKLCVL